jgi:hypothetical protein
MFARTQDLTTREAAALQGQTTATFVWCSSVGGAGGLAYSQASIIGSSKRFAHQGPLSVLGARKPFALVNGLANRMGNPEDRP